jgi:hypothetical protein
VKGVRRVHSPRISWAAAAPSESCRPDALAMAVLWAEAALHLSAPVPTRRPWQLSGR